MADETSETPSIRIVMSAHGRGEVYVDGVKIDRVRGFSFIAAVGECNRMLLDIVAARVEIEGPADVTDIGDEARRYVE